MNGRAGAARRGLAPRELQRAVARHRVLLAAARDLTSGAALQPEDLVAVAIPQALVPEGALTDLADVVGRLAAGPVRRGEPLTDVRLLGAGLLGDESTSGGGSAASNVAVPVRVAEPLVSALVRSGDRVDLLAAAPDGGAPAAVVASGVRVLSLPAAGDDSGEGALVVVAADRATAARLAAAVVSSRLSLVVLPRR